MSTTPRFRFGHGTYDGHDALFISFEVSNEGMLCTTKEYSLSYTLDMQEWHGDVIAYGQWVDLDAEEIQGLRYAYDLDALVAKRINAFW